MEAYLEYEDKEGRPQRFKLRAAPGFKIIIGRSPTCNLRLNSRLVGRNHGSISFEKGGFIYHDMGSVNGTKINDEKVSTRKLKANDVIVLGDQRVIFRVEQDDPIPAKPSKRPTTPPAAGGLSAEIPRLRQENEALRKRCHEMARKLGQEQKAAESARAERDQAISRLRTMEAELKKFRDKEVAYSIDLHNLVDRNKELAERIKFQQPLLEQAREEVQNIQAQNNALRAQVTAAQEQADSLRRQLAEYKQRIEDFKVKMTQAQREIDQIQRDNDIKDYDLRTIREENEILREKAATIEENLREQNKRVRDFEVIIEENRGHIEELRRQIAQKNDEIESLQARLSGGANWDRESELREELKAREQEIEGLRGRVTELAGRVSAMEQEKLDLTEKIRELQQALDEARKTPTDISDHPEYKDKIRALSRMEAEIAELNRTVDELRVEANEAGARASKAVETRMNELQDQVKLLRQRNETLKKQLREQPVETTNESMRVRLEELGDTMVMIEDTFSEIKAFFHGLARLNLDLPGEVFMGLGVDSTRELEALLEDQLKLLTADIKQLQSEIGGENGGKQ